MLGSFALFGDPTVPACFTPTTLHVFFPAFHASYIHSLPNSLAVSLPSSLRMHPLTARLPPSLPTTRFDMPTIPPLLVALWANRGQPPSLSLT